MENLGIYVQVPFCASKCTFCNFTSRVAPSSVFDDYCDALKQEVERLPANLARLGAASGLCNLLVDTVYFGGGTPSLLEIGRLEQLIHTLRDHFQFSGCPECTLEVTPGSADELFCEEALVLGINRLSIGAQSFVKGELSSTGRLHTPDDTKNLVRAARSASFSNISIDLIAGLPNQSESSWLQSVHAALELRPEHISVYLFEIDEKSRLGAERLSGGSRYQAPSVPDDDFMASAYETAVQLLTDAGYHQYEISNFSLPGRESRHNQKYWQLRPYIGLGAGAHSFDGTLRWANESAVERYQERIAGGKSPTVTSRVLLPAEQLEEFFFLGLRQTEGVDLKWARQHWGDTAVNHWEAKLAALAQSGWVRRQADRIVVPESAFLVSNEIFQEFLGT